MTSTIDLVNKELFNGQVFKTLVKSSSKCDIGRYPFGLMLNFNWAFTLEFVLVFFVLSIAINASTFMYLLKKASWKYYFGNIGTFILLILVYLVFKITIGNPDSQGDQGNDAVGLLLIILFFISLFSIIVGNLIGFFLKKYFDK